MKSSLIFIFVLLTLAFPPATSAAPTAEEILARSDEIRSPQFDYAVNVTVTSVKPEGEKRVAKYEVLIKGRGRTIVKTLSPEADKGRTLLMSGSDLWAFLPDVSKPIRISLQQRLIGEVANGDIARANFSGDYSPKLLGTEDIEGKRHYVLELLAKNDEVTYGRVLYRVKADNFNPLKAEFYAASGRLLKTCSYEDYRDMGGRKRPARLVLKDPLVKGRQSSIEYHDMKMIELPEKYFTKDYMKKLKY